MKKRIWDEQYWVNGVLAKTQIQALQEAGEINTESGSLSIGESSFDLTITNMAWKLKPGRGTIKPFGGVYRNVLNDVSLFEKMIPEEDNSFALEDGHTYVFGVNERLLVGGGPFNGHATAKSSVGRVDVIVRLIVDGEDEYDIYHAENSRLGHNEMFIEVSPITFSVQVQVGTPLTQLRLFYGPIEDAEIDSAFVRSLCIVRGCGSASDGILRVDLTSEHIGGLPVCAFQANTDEDQHLDPIKLFKSANLPDPCNYWRFWTADQAQRLTVVKNRFYILRSKELLAVPPGVAVYCRAMDEALGEMRIHYAGFVHPYFGYDREDQTIGTPLIFELRGHDLNVTLRDGEKLAKLVFYRMSTEYDPTKDEDRQTRPKSDDYTNQRLKLSNYFAKFPDRLELYDRNRVREAPARSTESRLEKTDA
ncbi:2'-deoxycytidine 5'-triphosphate deaminase [candidate division KSB1 bacterium]|nr:2'-deoxycytidine 5'-triphosphate deaminase [candidate division KSB1 bacterium]